MEIKAYLNQKILVYPIFFMTLHNLLNMHFVFDDQKICIQYHLKDWGMPFTKQPSEKQKLTSKLLRYEGWEVLDLSQVDFKNWETEERLTNIKEWLLPAKSKQVERGLIKDKWEPPL